MRLVQRGVEISSEDGSAPLAGPGTVQVGPFELTVDVDRGHGGADWSALRWSLANRSEVAAGPRHVRLVFDVLDPPGVLQMFRHGYQSWSPTGVATFGTDADPSVDDRCFRFVRDAYLCDPERVTTPGELRSELVTVLGDADGFVMVGFEAATRHDGTFRLRHADDGRIELVVEAFFGGALVPPGATRELHAVICEPGPDAAPLLEAWADHAGRVGGARVDDPYQVGWCSWYHYFHDVTEDAVRSNLALADDWPFAVFQVDDGYQSEIGDWLTTNHKFPSGLEALATDIAAAGYRPGLWLAPFLASPASRVATEHPDWLVQLPDGSGPLPSWFNPPWGGVMWGLDTTNPEVQDHLASIASALVAMGFTYIKLDFTMAPGLDGRFHDLAMTPAERVRAGYESFRRGAGEDTFLLGCGAPIGPCIGMVNGMRIGPDVAPSWELDRPPLVPSLGEIEPATLHAYRNTITRAFQHRRLWLNDPDCLMLRTEETALSADAARTWAHVVGVSGGMALVSDDLSLVGPAGRALLDEVLAIGRVTDEAARNGSTARSADLLEGDPPRRLAAAAFEVVTEPGSGASVLHVAPE